MARRQLSFDWLLQDAINAQIAAAEAAQYARFERQHGYTDLAAEWQKIAQWRAELAQYLTMSVIDADTHARHS